MHPPELATFPPSTPPSKTRAQHPPPSFPPPLPPLLPRSSKFAVPSLARDRPAWPLEYVLFFDPLSWEAVNLSSNLLVRSNQFQNLIPPMPLLFDHELTLVRFYLKQRLTPAECPSITTILNDATHVVLDPRSMIFGTNLVRARASFSSSSTLRTQSLVTLQWME